MERMSILKGLENNIKRFSRFLQLMLQLLDVKIHIVAINSLDIVR
jgi:hypothetical protein